MGTCAGCGVELPGPGARWDRRSLASVECQQLYGEVAGYELQHVAELGRWHQLLVDTYGVQHSGPDTPAIGTAFGLIGLRLALEEDRDGPSVRAVHAALARAFRDWPAFERPAASGTRTIFDLAVADSPADHVARLRDWAADVWAAWSGSHDAVRRLLAERLPAVGAAR
ncbi:MAG TPA: DUF5946 family protein [Candidatus Limnocylindrales bacterium]|nr:DUF5946 family protein [Candidatus Limnocylindrales bacterium]